MRPWLRFALLAVAAVLAAQLGTRLHRSRAIPAAGTAPDFTLPALDGGDVTLSALRGRVVAVNFWATWCGPCKAEIPDLAAVYAATRGRCLEVLGVAEDSGGREEIGAAAKALGINYPVLIDAADGRVGELYDVPAYPRTVLVDAEGKVRRVLAGAVDRPLLEEALAPLLAEAPASCPARR